MQEKKMLLHAPSVFKFCGQFLFACRREITTLPEVALDLSPIIATGTAVLQQQHQKRYH
jgi:hypothetical protein